MCIFIKVLIELLYVKSSQEAAFYAFFVAPVVHLLSVIPAMIDVNF